MKTLNCKGKLLIIDQPLVMGIINATPDSFYSRHSTLGLNAIVSLAGQMQKDGATILDIGGQSTRPGSERITALEETARVLPVIEAIKTVMDGQPYYCISSSQRLVKLISNSNYNPYTNKSTIAYSERELSIIKLICEEKSSKEIGELLFMSSRTVEGIRAKILEKMKVKTPAGIAIYAIKNNLYNLEF